MFRVKICGITSVDDALMAAQAGADAIGLNFYPRSPRFVTVELARQIVRALPGNVTKVGLFVNAAADEICRAFDDLKLDLIQLHGDESPEFIRQLAPRPAMRAFRLGPAGLEPIFAYLGRCGDLRCVPTCVLLDAFQAGTYGGTGRMADWTLAAQYARETGRPPLVLAGGLDPTNVAEAIRAVHPAAVDVASGVETGPGRKDRAAVTSFVKEAKAGWA